MTPGTPATSEATNSNTVTTATPPVHASKPPLGLRVFVDSGPGASPTSPALLSFPVFPSALIAASQTPDGRSSDTFSRHWQSPRSSIGPLTSRARPASTTNIFDEGSSGGGGSTAGFRASDADDAATDDDDAQDGVYRPLLPTLPQTGGQSISCETMLELLRGSPTVGNQPTAAFAHLYDRVVVVDARFPYEYQGGHIKGAVNLYRDAHVYEHFLRAPPPSMAVGQRTCIVFHCEFSQERGPHLFKRLRGYDREMHALQDDWNTLFYPEMYVLAGGYKALYGLYGSAVSSSANTPTPGGRGTPSILPVGHQTPTALESSGAASPAASSCEPAGLNSPRASFPPLPPSSSFSPSLTPRGLALNRFYSIAGAAGPVSGGLDGGGVLVASPSADSRVSFDDVPPSMPPHFLFEPDGYVRMRDARFKSECAVLMRDHESEKKMTRITRSQSTGELQRGVIGGAGAAIGVPLSARSHSSSLTSLPFSSPNVSLATGGSALPRTLLTSRLEAAAAAAIGSSAPAGPPSTLAAQVEAHLHDLSRIRRRSLHAFRVAPNASTNTTTTTTTTTAATTPTDGSSPITSAAAGDPTLFSPIASSRSPLLSRQFSNSIIDSPLSPTLFGGAGGGGGNTSVGAGSTPCLRATMTPSPSPLLANFSLGSPTSRATSTPAYSNLSSLNCSHASPAMGSIAGDASLHAALVAAAANSSGGLASPPFGAVLPPSPPRLMHSRSDFTNSFRRHLGGSIGGGGVSARASIGSLSSVGSGVGSTWGVNLAFASQPLTAMSDFDAGTATPSLRPSSASRSRTPASNLDPCVSEEEDEKM